MQPKYINSIENKADTTVFVGLSGGVDSSVSAALLKEAGFNVVGCFIKAWNPPFLECTWKEDRTDAMRVCAHMDIPFREIDLESDYKEKVVDYMIEEYKVGRTPNPDVMCNGQIKFGAFFRWATDQGADYVATGHYSQLRRESSGDKHDTTKVQLLAGVDTNKDQSYFLWQLKQNQLQKVLFPIGHLEKPQVREIASDKNLITAEKKDSQGLCFIGHVDMPEFLGRFLETEPGDVLSENGEVIGRHNGAIFYTIGQRHGFDINEKTPNDKPRYVIDKDLERNTITVTQNQSQSGPMYNTQEVILNNHNWITKAPSATGEYGARIRYRQTLQKCRIKESSGDVVVTFDDPQKSVALGQSCVIYSEDTCLGGGIISATNK